jgi:hypothetical protein
MDGPWKNSLLDKRSRIKEIGFRIWGLGVRELPLIVPFLRFSYGSSIYYFQMIL